MSQERVVAERRGAGAAPSAEIASWAVSKPKRVCVSYTLKIFACVVIAGCGGRVGVDSDPADANALDVVATDVTSQSPDSAQMTGGVLDGSVDAASGSPLSRGTWVTTAVTPDCSPSIALDPATAIAPLQWIACASGRAGCRTARIDWHSRDVDGTLRAARAQRVGAKVFLPHHRMSADWLTSVVQEGFDGPAIFAASSNIRAPVFCSFAATFDRTGLAITGFYGGSARDVAFDNRPIFGFAEPGRIEGARFRIAGPGEVTPGASGFSLYAGERKIFATDGRLFDPTTLALSGPRNGVGSFASMVPDGALRPNADFTRLELVRNDSSLVTWVNARGKSRLNDQSFDARTRDTVIWTECGESGAAPDLWVTGYDADPARVVARRVGRFPPTTRTCGAGAVVDGGIVAVTLGPDRAAIFRLSDGKGWAVSGEPGLAIGWPVWIDDAEIVLATTDKSVQTNLLRIRRDTLGEPSLSLGP